MQELDTISSRLKERLSPPNSQSQGHERQGQGHERSFEGHSTVEVRHQESERDPSGRSRTSVPVAPPTIVANSGGVSETISTEGNDQEETRTDSWNLTNVTSWPTGEMSMGQLGGMEDSQGASRKAGWSRGSPEFTRSPRMAATFLSEEDDKENNERRQYSKGKISL